MAELSQNHLGRKCPLRLSSATKPALLACPTVRLSLHQSAGMHKKIKYFWFNKYRTLSSSWCFRPSLSCKFNGAEEPKVQHKHSLTSNRKVASKDKIVEAISNIIPKQMLLRQTNLVLTCSPKIAMSDSEFTST